MIYSMPEIRSGNNSSISNFKKIEDTFISCLVISVIYYLNFLEWCEQSISIHLKVELVLFLLFAKEFEKLLFCPRKNPKENVYVTFW